jgi:hypothetical protein
MEDITKSAGRYHTHIGALALDHHVCRHGGAVQHKVNVCRRYFSYLAHFHNALDDTDRLIRGGRRYFVHEDLLARSDGRLLQDNVGKRTSNINADTYHDLPPSLIVSARPGAR